jgi:FtsZ-binding cell division protein ZapB
VKQQYIENYYTLMNKIKKEHKKWKVILPSWIGKMSLLKCQTPENDLLSQ